MPVGPFDTFDECVHEMSERYDAVETAKKVCGALQERSHTEGAQGILTEGLADVEKELGLSEGLELGPVTKTTEYKETETVLVEGLVEATGREWDVTIIRPGVSLKGVQWDDSILAEAAKAYERIPVGINALIDRADHEEDSGKARTVVGWLDSVKHTTEGLKARLHIIESARELRTSLLEAHRSGKHFGLSHVVRALSTEAMHPQRGLVRRVERILRPEFVDIVARPSAGGTFDLLVAGENVQEGQMPAATQNPDPKPTPPTPPTPPAGGEQTPKPTPTPPTLPTTPDPAAARLTEAESTELANLRASRILDERLSKATDLPADAIKMVRSAFPEGKTFTEAEVEAKLTEVRGLLDLFSPRKAGGAPRVQAGASEYDKMVDYITESWFQTKTHRNAAGDIETSRDDGGLEFLGTRAPLNVSVKRDYVMLTGDQEMKGRVVGGKLTESIATTTFAELMGDSVTRSMLAQYRRLALDTWRAWVEVTRLGDFRVQRRVRLGGYGNLPAVAQGAAYLALTTPTDEEATYVPTKRGGTEDMTMEAIANDDLKGLRDIPKRLARAAGQTLHEYVYDFLRTNALIYDGLALAVAGHNNIAVTALSAAELAASRLRMAKQAEMDNAKRLGIRPRYLVVPLDQEQIAYELLNTNQKPGGNLNDVNFLKQFNLSIITVEYWTDANDWWLIADPADTPTLELGFFEGRQEPEIFVQDMPNVGTVFTNDKLTWKIRHIYGGAVMDFRGFCGNIVP